MLQVYNKAHIKIGAITQCEELKIDTEITDGVVDKTLSFSIYKDYAENLELEGYLRTKDDEFVIKEMDFVDDYYNITAILNIEEFESETFGFEHIEVKVDDVVKTIAAGTGYTVTVVDTITKKRTIRQDICTLLDLLKQVCKTYMVEMQFDTINKTLKVYNQLGTDKGEYFMDTVNAEKIENDSDTLDYCTKLICSGKVTSDEQGNDTTIRCTVTNNTYSDKVITKYWKDERYTILADLQEDAQLKLDEMAQPKVSYKVDIVKLGNVAIGDIITLINKSTKTRLKTRVVKLETYPMEQGKDTVEISSKMYSFEDIQKTYADTSNTVDNITSDNGTISESALKQPLDKLIIQNAYINNLSALVAKIGTLDVGEAHITYLDAVSAKIQNLEVNSATISDLQATNAKIGTLEAKYGQIDILQSDVATINNLIAGNVSAGSTQTIVLNANNTTIANALIKSAMIESLDVNKINAGTISTNKFTICSDSGAINIADSTMQFKDSNGNVRIQLGQAADGTFNFLVRAEDGKTTLLTPDGITENAIADNLIKTDMMADKSVKGKKIDWDDFFTTINADGTHTLNSSKVKLNSNNQTLDVAFNQLITASDRNLYKNSCNVDDITKNYTNGYSSLCKAFLVSYNKQGRVNGVIPSNGTYSISFYYKCDVGVKDFEVDLADVGYNLFRADTTWKKAIIENIKVTNGYTHLDFNCTLDISYTANLLISDLMVTNTTVAKNYYPAPEDTKEEIKSNTTSISVQQGKITEIIADVSNVKDNVSGLQTLTNNYNTVVDTVNSHTQIIGSQESVSGDGSLFGSVKSINSNISQLQNQILLKVESSTYETDKQGILSDISNISSSISILQDGIKTKVTSTDVQNAINNINLDMQNLFKNTAWVENITKEYANGYNSLSKAFLVPYNKQGRISGAIPNNGTYSISFYYKCDVGVKDFEVDLADSNYSEFRATTTWQKATLEGIKVTNGYCHLDFNCTLNINYTANVLISNLMVVKGSKAIEYAPAPSDVKSYTDTKVSSVEQEITSSAICNKISTAVNGGTSSISTTYFIMDNAGFTIKNGGIKVLNNSNTQIFGVDINTQQLLIRGELEQFNSNGRKSVEIKNNALRIYNYKSTNDDLVGGFANVNDFTNTSGDSGIALYGTQGHALSIGMKRDNTITKYITCVDNGDGDTDRRIDVQMETYFRGWGATFCNNDFTMKGFIKADAGAETGLCIIGANALHLGYGSSSSNYASKIDISANGITIWGNVTVAGTINGQRIGN